MDRPALQSLPSCPSGRDRPGIGKVLVAQLLPAAAMIAVGCSADLEAVQLGREAGLPRSYTNRADFPTPAEVQFDRLVCAIQDLGGDILVSDRKAGIVSWIDVGYAFHLPPGLRTRLEAPALQKLGRVRLSTWHGFVHASARVKQTPQGVRVYVKAVARDELTNQVRYSDGHFESLILKRLTSLPAGSGLSAAAGRLTEGPATRPSPPSGRTSNGRRHSYWGLYYDHFRTLRPFPPREVFERGLVQTLPAAVQQAWEACLDLMWQYDGIAALSASDRVAVLARSTSMMHRRGGKGQPQFVDVLLVLAVRPNPQGHGSQVGIGWVEPPEMKLRRPEPTKPGNRSAGAAFDRENLRRKAALELTGRLVIELATQLSWRESLLPRIRSAPQPATGRNGRGR
ncbi:MAG: hypothetical protein AMK72_11795 [Planctomycetes bacterium SM23_25]|nr:MAG: hypothetical protein AMK72_11795 [Planctomycetes bacterium SM23_25]